jgi:predicted NBD/HSP70 family sugar kinase
MTTPSAGDLLRLLRQRDAMTRAELLEATGLSRSTLGPRLDRLVERRLVVAEAAPSTGGRPPSRFAFNPGAGVVLAADLGATHGRIAVADLAGTTLASESVEIAIADGPESVLHRVLATFDELLARSSHRRDEVWSTGIGLPGPVDVERGRPVRPPIMPGWDDVDVRGWFAGRIPGPVFVDNDVNVIALGEYWHTWHPEVADVLHVKVATGIGAGIIADGGVFRGARGAAGDIGHIRVESPRVVVCDCGNENCLEAVASGRALARDLREAGYDTTSTMDVVELVAAGNPDAVLAVRTAGRRLGEALAAAVNLLNPEVIVVSGDLVGAHDHLLAGVREVVYQRSTALATQSLRIVEARLADEAGIEGCIVLALEALLAADVIDELVEGTGPADAIA